MSDPTDGPHAAYCELSFSPNASLVSTVRRFVSEFYVHILTDGAITSQIAVATHEFLDNAVVYSEDGNTSVRIDVRRKDAVVEVSISTRNRASRENIARVRTELDALSAAPDPNAYYQKMMRETALREDGSGLGLARVRAESDMTITYEIHDNIVQLRGTAAFPLESK